MTSDDGTMGADRDDLTSRLAAEMIDLLRRAREAGIDLATAAALPHDGNGDAGGEIGPIEAAAAAPAAGSAATQNEPTRSFEPRDRDAGSPSANVADEETDLMPRSGPGSRSKSSAKPGPDTSAADPPLLGGRYRVVRPHAEGGLGVVHVANDEELDREVAVKRIRPDKALESLDVRERFEREGRITGGLEHPGIAPVYSLGVDPQGRPFYAMRLIRGETMRQALKKLHAEPGEGEPNAVPPEKWNLEFRDLLRRFLSVCETVQYAHERGVLHRDLKPSNVVLGEHGETIVLDWGLAKIALGTTGSGSGLSGLDLDAARHPSWGSSLELTLPGSVVGTVSYMSPEQSLGRTSVASDVFNLGATLYSILSGRAPYHDREDTAELLKAVRAADFPAPGSLTKRPVPRALEAVCLKAMAGSPDARYQTARDLGEDVERWLADEPVTAFRDGPATRARRWFKRHRPLAAAMITTAVAGVLGLIALNVLTESLRRAAVDSEAEARVAEADAKAARDRADALYKRARGLVSQIALPVADRLAALPLVEELRQQVAGEMAEGYRAFKLDPSSKDDDALALEASRAFRVAGNIRRLFDEDEPAGRLYDEALAGYEAAAKVDPARRPDVAFVRIDRASWNLRHGRVAAAEAELDAARQALSDETASPFLLGLIHLERANLRLEAGRPTEARAEAEQALARFQAAGPKTLGPILIGYAQIARGAALRDEGRLDEAIPALESTRDDLREQSRRKPFDSDLAFARANASFALAQAQAQAQAKPDDPDVMKTTLPEAFQTAAQLYNDHRTLPHLKRFLAEVFAFRAERNAAANKLDAAAKDAAQAVALCATKNGAVPTVYADLAPSGRALAASARVARASGRPRDEVRTLLNQARARHAAALTINPTNQSDLDAVAEIEAELKELE